MSKNMIRKQLYILPEQADSLKENSRVYGVSEGQLVRDALENFLYNPSFEQKIDIGLWEEELRFVQTCREKSEDCEMETKVWKRAELYDC